MTSKELSQFIRLHDACFPFQRMGRDTRLAAQRYIGDFDAAQVRTAFDALIDQGRSFPPTISEIRGRVIELFVNVPEYLRPALPDITETTPDDRRRQRQRVEGLIKELASQHSLYEADRELQ